MQFCKQEHTKHAERERISCNICGGEDTREYLDMGHFSYAKCTSCGVVYQNPRPVAKEIEAIYQEGYFEYERQNDENFFNLALLGLKDINFNGLTKDFEEKRVLDIGCATGLLLNHLKMEGWECKGVEICASSAKYAREKFSLYIEERVLEEVRFADNYFSVVHLAHLIEHVKEPLNTLKEIYRILRPGGIMVLTTPNVASLGFYIHGRNWRSAIDQHLYLFSKTTIKRAAKEVGFSVEKIVSWGSFLPVDINPPKVFKRAADKFVKFFNLGDVMLVLCRKPIN